MSKATDLMGVGMSAAAAGQVVAVVQTRAQDTVPGAVVMQPVIANIGAAPSQADFNGLLAALRLAGVIKT